MAAVAHTEPPPPPLFPPVSHTIRSWKDVCTAGDNMPKRFKLDPKLFVGKVSLSFGDGPNRTPNISFDASILDALSQAWEFTLIFRPLGARFKLDIVAQHIKDLLQINGSFNLSDLPRGYFLLKLSNNEDYQAILTGGPWKLFGHYLAFRPWSIDFNPSTDSITTTPVWVRILSLPVLFYEESTLTHIAAGLGKPVKVDVRTLCSERSRYAKVCVNLDLSTALPKSMIIQGIEYQVEVENLHAICSGCGIFGHFLNKCPKKSSTTSSLERMAGFNLPEQSTAVLGNRWQSRVGKKWVQKLGPPPLPKSNLLQQPVSSPDKPSVSTPSTLSHSPEFSNSFDVLAGVEDDAEVETPAAQESGELWVADGAAFVSVSAGLADAGAVFSSPKVDDAFVADVLVATQPDEDDEVGMRNRFAQLSSIDEPAEADLEPGVGSFFPATKDGEEPSTVGNHTNNEDILPIKKDNGNFLPNKKVNGDVAFLDNGMGDCVLLTPSPHLLDPTAAFLNDSAGLGSTTQDLSAFVGPHAIAHVSPPSNCNSSSERFSVPSSFFREPTTFSSNSIEHKQLNKDPADFFIDLKINKEYLEPSFGIGLDFEGSSCDKGFNGPCSPLVSMSDFKGNDAPSGRSDSGFKRGFLGPLTRAKSQVSSTVKAPFTSQNTISSEISPADDQPFQKLKKHSKPGARPRNK